MVSRVRGYEGQQNTRTFSMRDRVRRRAESREQQGSWVIVVPEGVHRFEPKVVKGGMRLDIIPYVVTIDNHPVGVKKGELWYERTYFVHRDVGVDNRARICLLKTFKKPCPICEYREELVKQGKERELIKALLPKERQLFNVIDLDDVDKGVQLWDVSYHLFGKQLEKEIREGKEEYAGFAELRGGFTLNVRFEARTLPTKDGGKPTPFMDADRIDFLEREDYSDGILDRVLNLDTLLVEPTYKQLQAEFLQLDAIDEDIPDVEITEEIGEKPNRFRLPVRKSEEELEESEESEEPEELEESDEQVFRGLSKASSDVRGKAKMATNSRQECPGGGEFGKDCDTLEACNDCPEAVWEACEESYRERKKSERKNK